MNTESFPLLPGLQEWLGWTREEVASWVSALPEPVVMGWPYNGTRRWYLVHRMENPTAEGYLETLIRHQAKHHRLVFEHGVSVLLAPGFGFETLKRGEQYTRYALGGLLRLAEDETYKEMFAAGLRLRFYGDYENVLDTPPYRPVLDACRELAANTAAGDGPLLLIGLFADDPYPTIARLGAEFAARHGRTPDRRELVEAYYGVPVPDLSLYLGFARPEMFDVPLIATGLEHLYVSLNPSPDLREAQLREILYDHLVTTRRETPADYDAFSPKAKAKLAKKTRQYSGKTLGLGYVDPATGIRNPVLPGAPDHDPPGP